MDQSVKLVSLFLLYYTVLCSATKRTTQFSIQDILSVNKSETNKTNYDIPTNNPVVEKSVNFFQKKFEFDTNDVDEILEIWNPKSVVRFWDSRTSENPNITEECEHDVSAYLTGVLNSENWALRSKSNLTFLSLK